MIESRLTLITLDYPPERGGVARYLGELVKAAEGAIDVIVDKNHDRSGPGSVSVREFFRVRWPHWWPLVRICRERVAARRVILVSHVFPVGTAAWIARFFGGPRYAVLFHGLDLRLARSLWKQWLLRRVCAQASALFVNSEKVKTELLSMVPRARVHVLTPAVEENVVRSRREARAFLGISSEEKLVVSVARLVPRKGIDIALETMSRVQKDIPCRYVVIGDGPDRDRLEGVAREHRTAVTWFKNLEDAEKWTWMAAADIFLLPVREEDDDIEGFGIVFLEAAACGVPSIAGRSGGVEEAVVDGGTGILVNPGSVESVEAGIRKLLSQPDEARRLGENGRERVGRDFRWKDRWDKLRTILEVTTDHL